MTLSTKAALREMILPGVITIVSPIIIGVVMGPEALGAYMAGVTVSGVLWAIFQNNAGGAWDNAKKSFEKGVVIDGETYYKKSEPHKAAVVGDTVGDPFKDTSGPSMNILIKLTSLVGLTIAPLIAMNHGGEAGGMDCCAGGEMKQECGMHEMCVEKTVIVKDGQTIEYCNIDSNTCAEWMASGKLDSSACVSMENGMCLIESAACDKLCGPAKSGMKCYKSGAEGKECDQACMEACEAKGMKCESGSKHCSH